MVRPYGGRGKKAPYETVSMRVPVPLKEMIESLCSEYRDRVMEEQALFEKQMAELIKSNPEVLSKLHETETAVVSDLKDKSAETFPTTSIDSTSKDGMIDGFYPRQFYDPATDCFILWRPSNGKPYTLRPRTDEYSKQAMIDLVGARRRQLGLEPVTT